MENNIRPSFDAASAEKNAFPKPQTKRFRTTHMLAFLILLILWFVFSGRFDGFHIMLGFISSAIVTAMSGDLMFTSHQPRGIFSLWLRWFTYIPWLLYQVLLANLHVMYLVFHPKMKEVINPKIIEFDSCLKSDYSRWTFANSITLTPGTITVNATVLGRFSVHCIDDKSGESLPGEMEKRIATIFRE